MITSDLEIETNLKWISRMVGGVGGGLRINY